MDISPGVSTEDESKLTEQSTTSATGDQQSSDLSSYTAAAAAAVGSFSEDSSASNSTFLNTLAKLQQALQQVTTDRLSSSSGNSPTKAVPSSVLSLLATLPSLIYKLKTAGESSQTTSLLCQSQPADQQQITVQGNLSSLSVPCTSRCLFCSPVHFPMHWNGCRLAFESEF